MAKLTGEALFHKQYADALKKGWRPEVESVFPWKVFLAGAVLGFILNGILTLPPIPDGFVPEDFGYGEVQE